MNCIFEKTHRTRYVRGQTEHLLQCQREGCKRRVWSQDGPERTYANCRATTDEKAKKRQRKCPQKSAPKWMRAGFSFAKAMTHWAGSGFKLVTEEQYESRKAVCDACEHKTKAGQCDVCKCFVAAKAGLATEDCPLKKWPSA